MLDIIIVKILAFELRKAVDGAIQTLPNNVSGELGSVRYCGVQPDQYANRYG